MIQTVVLPQYGSTSSGVRDILSAYRGKYILLNLCGREVNMTDEAEGRLLECARATGAGMVYSDYLKMMGTDAIIPAPLIDIQTGSLRDDFDFGALVLITPAGIDAYLKSEVMRFRKYLAEQYKDKNN